MVTASTSNRLRQAVRLVHMRKRMAQQRDPAIAGMLDDEIDRAIQRSRDALNRDPRANGIKRFLRALVTEKNLRYARRQNGPE